MLSQFWSGRTTAGASKELGLESDWGGDLRRDLVGLDLLRVIRGYGPGQWIETNWHGVLSIMGWLEGLVEHTDDETSPAHRTLGLRWLMANLEEADAERFRKILRRLGLLIPHSGVTRGTVYRFDRDAARRLLLELGELNDGNDSDRTG